MTSKRKTAANRRNAQNSTGPKTAEGKAASAQNATSHGLSSSFTVLPHEDHDAYARLLESLHQEHTPTTEHEKFLVVQMAESRWRLDRTNRFEAIAFDQFFDEYDDNDPDHLIVLKLTNRTANIMDLLQRYRTSAERAYYKAHRELASGRKGEKRNEAKDPLAWIKAKLDDTPDTPEQNSVWRTPSESERNEPNSPVPSGGNNPALRL
jgi:hypothetical protein